MNNVKLYDAVRSVPEDAQKKIGGGRLVGMTDINPMWRIKTLTEQFGPAGIGWYTEINKMWMEVGNNGEIAAFVQISLYIKVDDKWSAGIIGLGGSMFVAKEKAGLYTSDEAYKMAYTDAISVACKALGFGADIYWQKDRTKYSDAALQGGNNEIHPDGKQAAMSTLQDDVSQGSVEGLVPKDKIPAKTTQPATQAPAAAQPKPATTGKGLWNYTHNTNSKYAETWLNDTQLDEIRGYSLDEMEKTLAHWTIKGGNLRVSSARLSQFNSMITEARANQGGLDDNYDGPEEDLSDLPF